MPFPDAPTGPSSAPRLELTDLRKSYQEGDRLHTVLDGACLRVAAGERVAILGPSVIVAASGDLVLGRALPQPAAPGSVIGW